MKPAQTILTIGFAVITLSLLAPSALAERAEESSDEAKKQQEADEKFRRELGYFSRSVELDAEQKRAMVEALGKREAALDAWDQVNRQRFRDYREQAREARQDGDKDAVKQIWSDARKLMAERRGIQAEHNQKIMDVMTDAQQLTYRESLLGRFVDRGLRGFEMTQEQQDLRDELVAAGAKKIGKAEADKRWGVLREESGRIVKAVRETMTEQQQAEAEKAAEARRAEWQKRRAEWRKQRGEGRGDGDRGKRPERSDRSDKSEQSDKPAAGSGGVDF